MRALVTRRRAAAAILAASLLLAACKAQAPAPALTQPSWPAPPNAMALAAHAGLEPTLKEFLLTHTHAHLDIRVDGHAVVVPAGIGINIAAPIGIDAHKTLDGTATEYFVTLCVTLCLSPLHTHDPSGLLHTESITPNAPAHTLGQFFTEWGMRLDASCVGEFCKANTSIAIYLDGTQYTGNPADIKLKSHLEIAIIIGTPPTVLPKSFDFGDQP